MAVATEQEMRAKAGWRQVIGKAEIPLAIIEALRNGNIGNMDYFNMKNIQ